MAQGRRRRCCDAGHRVILPDLAGLRPLGQADGRATGTPTTATSRSPRTLLEDLDLRDATFVVHDWGGPIGLRLAVEHPERVDAARADGHRPVHRRAADERRLAPLRATSSSAPRSCRSGMLVRRGCPTDPGDEVAAAYDAPFPSEAAQGRRARVPGDPDPADARRAGRGRGPARAGGAARATTRPTLMLWGARGPGRCRRAAGEAFAGALGQPAPRRDRRGAGHFLQEDQGAADRRDDRRLAGLRLAAERLRLVGRGLGDDRLGGGRARGGARLVGRAGAVVGAAAAPVGPSCAPSRSRARARRQRRRARRGRPSDFGTKTSKRGTLSASTICARRPPRA